MGSDFSAVTVEDLLSSAGDCFRSAKGAVDSLLNVIVSSSEGCAENIAIHPTRNDDDMYISIRRHEILQIAKVCVTNSLFIHKLGTMEGGELGSGGRRVSLAYNAHKHYCTLIIT